MNPYKLATTQEKAQCVSWFIKTKSERQTQQNYKLSMEEIHHHVRQFVHGIRNLWRQGKC